MQTFQIDWLKVHRFILFLFVSVVLASVISINIAGRHKKKKQKLTEINLYEQNVLYFSVHPSKIE